jgi:hypothetical protein
MSIRQTSTTPAHPRTPLLLLPGALIEQQLIDGDTLTTSLVLFLTVMPVPWTHAFLKLANRRGVRLCIAHFIPSKNKSSIAKEAG